MLDTLAGQLHEYYFSYQVKEVEPSEVLQRKVLSGAYLARWGFLVHMNEMSEVRKTRKH